MRDKRNAYKILMENAKKSHLEGIRVNTEVILKWRHVPTDDPNMTPKGFS
jgi:hypothetical protein